VSDNKDEIKKGNAQADDQSIAIGSFDVGGGVSGNIRIGHTIGYTADEVSDLINEISSTFQPKTFDGRCPYKGLDVFEEQDAELFFGREKIVDDLVERVKGSRTVFITGPSGSGKSSLVRAGLIPALKRGGLKNSERWLYETVKPGRDPLEALALAFSRLKSPELGKYFRENRQQANVLHECAESALSGQKDQRLILFFDQFEEVFTQVGHEETRAAFLNLLTHAATVKDGRIIILFAMRSDFVSNCATYPELNALLNQEFVQIGAMGAEELVSAIAQPALRVGLRIAPDLIAQIINDMQGEPGALPLMQFALKDLFEAEQAKGGMIALTREAYLGRGGIRKSLERHADESLANLDEKEQELARFIFSGLIEIGRGTQDTKRTAIFEELVPSTNSAEEVTAILQKLEDARLVTTEEKESNKYTITHETLINAWPWLKKLVNKNRDVIALQNQIAMDAKEWDDKKRDTSYLYTGARLANAREQLSAKKLVLTGLTQEFVEAGRARHRRGRVALITGISTILVLLLFAVVIFRNQAQENIRIANIAQANQHAAIAQAKMERQLALSILLSVEAFNELDNFQTRGALLDTVRASPHLKKIIYNTTPYSLSVAFSPDGKILAYGSGNNIILRDISTQRTLGQPLQLHSELVMSIAFSPDGKMLASGSIDGTVILWDMETHQPLGRPINAHENGVYCVAFSPNGKMLASGGNDRSIILWDVETHQPLGQPLDAHSYLVYSIAFSPDGKTLASGEVDNSIGLWDVETHQSIGGLYEHKSEVHSVAFSPDGKILASGANDDTIILWDMATLQPIGQSLKAHTRFVDSVVFSPDGKTLASGSGDGTIRLWDVATQQLIEEPLTGHSGFVFSVSFSPDGKTIASSSNDGTVILWDMVIQNNIGQRLEKHTSGVNSVAFSPDGKLLASGSNDGTIILWDVETHKSLSPPLDTHWDDLNSIAFSPNGNFLAAASGANGIKLWDIKTHGQIKTESLNPITLPLQDGVMDIAFSHDSKMLALGGIVGGITLLDVKTWVPINKSYWGDNSTVFSVAFSPDSKTLAAGTLYGNVLLFDLKTLQPIGQPLTGHTNDVFSLAFSPDGKILASGSNDSTIILWDVETGQQIDRLIGHTDGVYSIAFSPNGKMLASGSNDNTIILWDIQTGQPIGQAIREHTDWVNSVAFSPEGEKLASGSNDASVILWDVNPKSWLLKACSRVGRNFTIDEWELYFPNTGYRKTCEQWPLEPEAVATPAPTP
jgi:WD40 repeat protein/energy-coupling factor transporter ATP-binding protein EcfA2